MAQRDSAKIQISNEVDVAKCSMKLPSSAVFLGPVRKLFLQTSVEQCHYHANEVLTDIFHCKAVSSFFNHQLLQRLNGGQAVMCKLIATATLPRSLQTAQHTRQAIKDQCMSTLQAYANQFAVSFPG